MLQCDDVTVKFNYKKAIYASRFIPLHAEIASFFGRKNTNFRAFFLPVMSVCLAARPCHGGCDSLYSLLLALTYTYSAGDVAAEAAKTKIARGDGVLFVAG